MSARGGGVPHTSQLWQQSQRVVGVPERPVLAEPFRAVDAAANMQRIQAAHGADPCPGTSADSTEYDKWPPLLQREELLLLPVSKLREYLRAVGLAAPEVCEKAVLVDWLSPPSAPPPGDDLNSSDLIVDLCDTNGSGSLEEPQLRMALRSRGLYPDRSFYRRLFGEAGARVDAAAFAHMAEGLRSSGCPRGLRAVPYPRRGMSLGQLKTVQTVFNESGWLSEQCRMFNKQHKEQIKLGKKFCLKENLYGLNEFLISQVTTPTPRQPVPERLKRLAGLPAPMYNCAYSKLANPMGVRVDYFCSHYWGHDFAETTKILEMWAERTHMEISKDRPELVTFWICIFALNQHCAGQEVGPSPEEGPFNSALNKAQVGAVLILDESAQPFKRIWCLFEVSRMREKGMFLELISNRGPVGRLWKEAAGRPEKQEVLAYIQQIEDELSQISAFRASASSLQDKHAIWHRIADYWLRKLPLSTVLSEGLFEDPDAFTQFDASIGALLAGALLDASHQASCTHMMSRYVGLGASFSHRHLEALRSLRIDPLTLEVPVPDSNCPGGAGQARLLHCAARFGHLESIRALFEHSADTEVRDGSHRTPLHCAARAGQVEIVKLLCSRDASLAVTDEPSFWTPLHYAAFSGHAKVVDVLTTCRACLEARTSGGWTPLFCSSAYGHHEAVQVLLLSSAYVNAQADDGQTPLHWSASRGHREVTRLLIANAAVLDVTDNAGNIAVHHARRGGHSDVEALLLQQRG